MTGVDSGLIRSANSAGGLAVCGREQNAGALRAHAPSAWRRGARAALAAGLLALGAIGAPGAAHAATTTVNTLIDTDNTASTGCSVTTANGAVAGIEQMLSTTVATDATGYRITSITLQSCSNGTFGAPSTIDSGTTPLARGMGTSGATAVETYMPAILLPATGQKMRVAVTTQGSNGLTGTDALTATSAGGPILVDAPPFVVVPTLATFSLLLTAILLAASLWYARRRGWGGMQMLVVAAFAISMSGQLLAIVRDGLITDWTGVTPAATDPLGDAPAGMDITDFYAKLENNTMFFRIDTVLNAPPVANDQSVTAKVGETLPITLTGADYENSPLTFTVLTQPTQGVLAGTAPNVTYTPNANATASDSFTFKVNDGALDSVTATVTITNTRAPQITSANTALFIPGQANSFTIASNGMPTPTASITACSPALPASVTFTANSTGGGTIAGNPTPAQSGDYNCTVNSINGVTPNATQAFKLQVGVAPTFTSSATINAVEGQLLTFAPTVNAAPPATSFTQSGALPSNVSFSWTSGNTASLSGTPPICSRGTYPITFSAANGVPPNGTQNASIVVAPVNQAPSFTAGAAVTVLEDSGAYSQPWATAISAGPSCESTQTLTFLLTANSNPGLFSAQPAISTTGQLTFTPAANANGSATITVRVQDNGGTANGGVDTSTAATLTINVTPVNDAPSFTKGADVTVLQNAPAQTITGWATAISGGPADESGQTLNFQVTNNSNPAMFSVAPAISSNGTLTFTPALNQPGTAAITVVLKDNGGTANGGVDTSAAQTFNINVTFVNQAPSFTKGADQTSLEDAGARTINGWATAISAGPANESAQVLNFQIASNSNPSLFSAAPAVSPTGTLTYTSAPNACGTATISLNIHDNGGTANGGVDTSANQNFVIAVTCVNDAPVFTKGADISVAENSGAFTAANWATGIGPGGGVDEAGQTVNFSVTNNTLPSLFAVPPAVASNGTLTFTPAPNVFGSATITLVAVDDGGVANGGVNTSAPQTFVITVTFVNQAPSFNRGPDQTVLEDAGAQTVANWATAISAGPASEAAQTVVFQITGNTNPGLFSAAPAISPSGTLTYTPAANACGAATLTVRVQDNGGTANGGVDTSPTQTLGITVTCVNDAPVFTKGADVTVLENSSAFSAANWVTGIGPGGGADEAGQTVSFLVTNNSNPGLFSVAPAVASNGTLSFTPAANVSGTATITLVAKDNGGTANGGVDTSAAQTFVINVTFVNQPPSFTKGADQSVLEDAGAQTVAGWATAISAGPPSESTQTLVFQIVGVTNSTLFSVQPAISPTGTLTYTPAANACGASTVSVRVQDSGGTANGGIDISATQTFVINVVCVNDPPSFVAGTNPLTVAANSGAYDQPWATGISMGPANEASQSGTFIVSNISNPSLFSAAPVVTAAGRLQFTPAANTGGSSTFDLKLQDNGGTANGGADTSATVTVTINVNQAVLAVNDTYGTPSSALTTFFNSAPFNASPPSALANDTLGFPAGGITGIANVRVVGWKLGTPVNTTQAGPFATSTAVQLPSPVTDGTVGVYYPAAPGGVSLTVPVNFWGYVEFDYTLSNGASSSTATVHIDVTKAPVAAADSGYLGLPSAISVAAPGVLANDDLGWQLATLVSFGGGSLGGTVDDHAAGTTATLAGRTLQVNADGSFSLAAGAVLASSVTFDYKIQNGSGTSTGTVTIAAPTPPSITQNPAATSVNAGSTATFTAAASGNPTPTVQWQVSTDGGSTYTDISGATSTTYSFTASAADDTKRYRAVFTNVAGNATTTGALLTVLVPPPTVTTSSGSNTFTEDGSPTAVDPFLTVTVLAGQVTGATAQITTNFVAAEDSLTFTNTGTITGTYTAATGLMTLTGTDTAANYQAALRSVRFNNNSQNPSVLNRTVSFTASNLAGAGNTATKTVLVVAINDAPVVTTSVGTTTFTEPSGLAAITIANGVAVDSNLTITDVDSANLIGATIAITGGSTGDTLGFVNQNGITGSLNLGGDVLTLTGSATVANYQTALRSIVFYNTSHDPVAGSRTVGFQVNDGASANNFSTVATKTVTLVPTNTPPTAKPYTATQNGKLAAQAGIPITFGPGTLTGSDAEAGTTVTVVTTPVSTCTGCSLTINANGSFSFTAPPAAAGTDVTFNYAVIDNGAPGAAQTSAAATVTIAVAGPAIYFVANPGSATGTCALDDKCTLSQAVTLIGSNTNSHIFITDASTYTAPSAITLNSGNRLIGQGVTGTNFDALFGISPPAGSAARPTIGLTNPRVDTTITANNTSHIRGINLMPQSGKGITANGKTGIVLSELVINMTTNGATGNALDFTNSTFDYQASALGIGGLVINATTGGGLVASGGGTITVQGTGNTITTTTGAAINVSGTSIGAAGLTFATVNANGGAVGINLANTGTAGGLTVGLAAGGACGGTVVDRNTVATGFVTTDCTGGWIQNAATGIRLDNTSKVSLNRIRISGTAAHNFGIYATDVTQFTLNRSVIHGSIGTSTGAADAPLVFGKLNVSADGRNGLIGASNFITDSWIEGGIEHNVEIYGQSNNFGLTVTRAVVKSNSATGGADGIQMELQSTALGRVLVDNSQFDDNRSQAIQVAANGDSTVHFTLKNSRWSKTTQGNEGVVFSNGANGKLYLDVDSNLVPGSSSTGYGGTALFVGQTPSNASAVSQLHATIRNNTITHPTSATNHTVQAMLTSTPGVTSTARLAFQNNVLHQYSTVGTARALLVDQPDNTVPPVQPSFHAIATNNVVHSYDPVAGASPLRITGRRASTACFHVAGNSGTVATAGVAHTGIRQNDATSSVSLQGPGADANSILDANHPALAPALTEVLGTITVGGPCAAPTLPSLP